MAIKYKYKISFIGDSASGKSSLLYSVFCPEFITKEHIPTIGLDVKTKYYHFKDKATASIIRQSFEVIESESALSIAFLESPFSFNLFFLNFAPIHP